MARRGFEESAPQSGVAQFSTNAPPAARQVAAVNFSGIQQALSNFTRAAQQVELNQAEQQATIAQRELGNQAVAEPTGFMMPGARRAFEQRAKNVYLQELAVNSLRNETLLRQQHRNDPAGFEAAWTTYTEETTKGLQESDPQLAAAAQAMLVEQGVKSWSAISDQAFTNELTLQQGQSLRQINEFKNIYSDRLLDLSATSDQRDLDLDEGLATIFDSLTESVRDGRILPQVFNAELADLEDSLRADWVRGNVASAIAEGRHGDALGYVSALQQGTWFTDNNKARALSNTLQSDVARALAGQSDYVRGLESAARQEARLQMMGLPTEGGAIAAYKNYAAISGSPEIQDGVLALELDMYAMQRISDIDRLGLEGLEKLDEVLADPLLDQRLRDALFEARNTRVQQINTALATNDVFEVYELFPRLSREEIAAAVNVDVDALPYVRPSSVAAAYELGKNTGDASVLAQLGIEAIEQGGSVADVAVAAMAAADRGLLSTAEATSVGLAAVVWGAGSANLANKIFMDADFTTSDPVLSGINFSEDFSKETEVFQVLSALAGHDAELRTAYRNAINNMYRADLARLDDPASILKGRGSVGEDIAEALTKEFSQIPITSIGGRSYPLSWFGTPEQGREREARAAALDSIVNELSETHGMMMRVVPEGDGSFTIYAGDSRNIPLGTFTPEATQNIQEQQRINTAIIQDRNAQEAADPTWLREIAEDNPVVATQASRERFNSRINSAAKGARVNEEDFRRLAVAVLQSSPEETASRFGSMALNVIPDPLNPFSLDHSTITERDAAAHFKTLLDKFGDVDQATAAYWSSDTEIQFFVDTFGDDWINNVPGNVRDFVYRARNANAEFAYEPTEPLRELERTPLFGGE